MNNLNLEPQINLQKEIVRSLVSAIEDLNEAMQRSNSHVVWSTLWDKSQELRKELDEERNRLNLLTVQASIPNRDQRRGAVLAAMQVGDRVILE